MQRSPNADGLLPRAVKDIEDVIAILRAHGDGLDQRHIEATLSTLEDALSQNDLLPTFRQTVATSRRH